MFVSDVYNTSFYLLLKNVTFGYVKGYFRQFFKMHFINKI